MLAHNFARRRLSNRDRGRRIAGGYVSHGVWQAWWWCLLALIGVLFVAHVSALSASLAAAFPAKPPRSEGASHSLK